MRWKIMHPASTGEAWSLGYPTRKAAAAAAARLNGMIGGHGRFRVEKMTPEDEALASELEQKW